MASLEVFLKKINLSLFCVESEESVDIEKAIHDALISSDRSSTYRSETSNLRTSNIPEQNFPDRFSSLNSLPQRPSSMTSVPSRIDIAERGSAVQTSTPAGEAENPEDDCKDPVVSGFDFVHLCLSYLKKVRLRRILLKLPKRTLKKLR